MLFSANTLKLAHNKLTTKTIIQMDIKLHIMDLQEVNKIKTNRKEEILKFLHNFRKHLIQ